MKSDPQIYVKGSVEAVAFYQRAFGLTMGMNGFNPDGTYEHASLMSGETCILSVAEDSEKWSYQSNMGDKRPHMSFNIYELGTDEAVNHA